VNAAEDLVAQAEELSLYLNAVYCPRNGQSIPSFFEDARYDRLMIVQRDQLSLHNSHGDEYQFHPNMAVVRATNYKKVGKDYYLTAANLKPGDKVIDCTLGFGCEALLASMIVGTEGEVVGLESDPELATVTRDGMGRYKMLQRTLQQAMRRVVVLNCDYRDYLRRSLTRSADIVYFDPFFKETLEGGTETVGSLAAFGNRAPLDIRSITEARRVARRAVIIKHPKWHPLPHEVAAQVKEEVSGRRSPITFAVIPPFGI
jgi:hypothetical protein